MLVFINLMPQDINLPDVKLGEVDASKTQLIRWGADFDRFFEKAAYFLEEKAELKGMDSIAFTWYILWDAHCKFWL